MNASLIQRASAAGALMLIFTIGSESAFAAYSWTEILIPSIGPLGACFGLNDKGQVAVQTPDGSNTGIYRGGIFTPLPPPPTGYTVSATGINNGGTIVGSAVSPSDPTHEQGFILIGSKYTFFSRPGWDRTEPRAIARTNTFTDATPPGSGTGFSITQGMNAAGRISGDGRLPDGTGRYAFIWQQGTRGQGNHALAPFLAQFRITDAGTAARGINDAGVVVGFTNSGVGFVGSDSRGFQLLIPPGGDAAGANVACEGINNFGQVVCTVTDPSGTIFRSFIGTPNDQ